MDRVYSGAVRTPAGRQSAWVKDIPPNSVSTYEVGSASVLTVLLYNPSASDELAKVVLKSLQSPTLAFPVSVPAGRTVAFVIHAVADVVTVLTPSSTYGRLCNFRLEVLGG